MKFLYHLAVYVNYCSFPLFFCHCFLLLRNITLGLVLLLLLLIFYCSWILQFAAWALFQVFVSFWDLIVAIQFEILSEYKFCSWFWSSGTEADCQNENGMQMQPWKKLLLKKSQGDVDVSESHIRPKQLQELFILDNDKKRMQMYITKLEM